MPKISNVAEKLNIHIEVKTDFFVDRVTSKSNECGNGVIFAALRGNKTDGHNFVHEAYKSGSRAFILDHIVNLPDDTVQLIVSDTRSALASVSMFLNRYPNLDLNVIGVTGTKGKSTVVHMMRKILEKNEIKSASISTVGFFDGDLFESTDNSTPESYIIASYLRRAVDNGAKNAIIEVSSQGVMQKRIDAISFDVGIMTNLSRDHIGQSEHKSFSEYKEYKKLFFTKCKIGIFNSDDKYYGEFSSLCNHFTYGITSSADVTADNISTVRSGDLFGTEFDVSFRGETAHVFLPMPGIMSVYDALAAITASLVIGLPLERCCASLCDFSIPGRFEKIITDRDIDVVVDYAHNGESMKNALITSRELAKGKVICVFGSVGGRTKMRRAALGKAADRFADFCIVTSDNPNFENPLDISADIVKNIKSKPYIVIPDREEAIRYACDNADDGDFIIICGKGHETYQLINGVKVPFDERRIIKSASKIKANI